MRQVRFSTPIWDVPDQQEHMARLAEVACGYSNLEYDLEAGRRGERYSHFEKLLCKITGAEAAMQSIIMLLPLC